MFSNPRKLLNTKKAAPKLNLFMLQINWTQEFLEIRVLNLCGLTIAR